MDLKAILKRCGVEGELVDTVAETINAEIPKEFVSKSQYNKKVNSIDTLNETIADLEAKTTSINTDEYKTKYEALNTEYEVFKTNLENEKTNNSKKKILDSLLKDGGFKNEKAASLIRDKLDLNKIEIEDGKVKGWETIFEPIKTEYADFITVETVTGTKGATPPTVGTDTGKFTREQIEGMTHEQIAANYEKIRGSLADL